MAAGIWAQQVQPITPQAAHLLPDLASEGLGLRVDQRAQVGFRAAQEQPTAVVGQGIFHGAFRDQDPTAFSQGLPDTLIHTPSARVERSTGGLVRCQARVRPPHQQIGDTRCRSTRPAGTQGTEFDSFEARLPQPVEHEGHADQRCDCAWICAAVRHMAVIASSGHYMW